MVDLNEKRHILKQAALVNLGFRPAEAWTAVTAATDQLGAEADAQALIRMGLATLTPKEHAR